jgi:glycosyltransferase involved in cell wall biosynthesis
VDAVEDGVTGMLVPPGDPDALRDAVQALLEDPELRRRLGAAGRTKALREFQQDVAAKNLIAVYAAAAPGKDRASGPRV